MRVIRSRDGTGCPSTGCRFKMIDGTVATSNDYNLTVIFAASSPKTNHLLTALSRRNFPI